MMHSTRVRLREGAVVVIPFCAKTQWQRHANDRLIIGPLVLGR
jgi:hypothetical protein